MKNNQLTTITKRFTKGVLRFFRRRAVNSELKKHYDQNGVIHDPDYVSKCIINSDRNFRENIENLNRDLLRGENVKTAVYLAAGIDSTENILKRYSNIQGVNNLILIDYRIEDYQCINVNDSFKIFNIPSEAVRSALIIEKCNITIDLLMELNCGINLGFGFFSLSSNQVLSLFEPFTNKDQFIFIGSYNYQKDNEQYMVARDYLSCFCYENKKLITKEELNELGYYIELSNLTNYPWSSKSSDITLFINKKENSEIIIEKGGIKLHFFQGNIFSMKNELDILLLYFRNLFMWKQYDRTFVNTLDIRGKYEKGGSKVFSEELIPYELYQFASAPDLIKFSERYKVKKVGFIPMKNFDYVGYVNKVVQGECAITDLYFFYYNPKDLNKIFRIKEIEGI